MEKNKYRYFVYVGTYIYAFVHAFCEYFMNLHIYCCNLHDCIYDEMKLK